jgi:hypothetical protein
VVAVRLARELDRSPSTWPRLDLVVVMTGGGDYDRTELLRLLLHAVATRAN